MSPNPLRDLSVTELRKRLALSIANQNNAIYSAMEECEKAVEIISTLREKVWSLEDLIGEEAVAESTGS